MKNLLKSFSFCVLTSILATTTIACTPHNKENSETGIIIDQNSNVSHVILDKKLDMLASTTSGKIFKISHENNHISEIANWKNFQINELIEDQLGNIYASTYNSKDSKIEGNIYKYNDVTNKFEVFAPDLKSVKDINVNSSGTTMYAIKESQKGARFELYSIDIKTQEVSEEPIVASNDDCFRKVVSFNNPANQNADDIVYINSIANDSKKNQILEVDDGELNNIDIASEPTSDFKINLLTVDPITQDVYIDLVEKDTTINNLYKLNLTEDKFEKTNIVTPWNIKTMQINNMIINIAGENGFVYQGKNDNSFEQFIPISDDEQLQMINTINIKNNVLVMGSDKGKVFWKKIK